MLGGHRVTIYKRRVLAGAMIVFCVAGVFVGGCGEPLAVDQSPYEDLSKLAQKDDAFVRLYGSLWFTQNSIAIHTWFLYRRGLDDPLTRWEVFPGSLGEYGVVRKNHLAAVNDFGGGVFVLGERRGTQAESVIDFIENESPGYPCRNTFHLIKGPNCNTYAQWVLEQTQWDVELPEEAIGKDFPVAEPVKVSFPSKTTGVFNGG